MKTKNFFPTLLALILRVMVSGQTPDSHHVLKILNALNNGKPQSSPSMGVAKKEALKVKCDAILKDKSVGPLILFNCALISFL